MPVTPRPQHAELLTRFEDALWVVDRYGFQVRDVGLLVVLGGGSSGGSALPVPEFGRVVIH
jgi:hypothetical protein